jgi:hypothetical protein
MDLIRRLLLAIETLPFDGGWQTVEIDGEDELQVAYHMALLLEAGLIVGKDVTCLSDRAPQIRVSRLTWSGHEFLESARDHAAWRKAMTLAKSRGVNLSFDLLKEILAAIARGALNV